MWFAVCLGKCAEEEFNHFLGAESVDTQDMVQQLCLGFHQVVEVFMECV